MQQSLDAVARLGIEVIVAPELGGDLGKEREPGLDLLDDLGGNDVRGVEGGGVGERLVLDVGPDVEVEARTLIDLLVAPALEVLGRITLV